MDSSHCSSHSDPIEVSFVCDKENKDETLNGLYGPGRTIGKFFDFGGRHIDVFLSKTAERMGLGPRVTALRIRRRRNIIVQASRHSEDRFCRICYWIDSAERDSKKFTLSPASITKKRNKIEKDIQRLLKYVNSKVPLTQKQAMDHILDLSIDCYEVRALLKANGATRIIEDSVQIYSKFRFGDFDDLLLSSSRKALVSLRDAKINTLLQEWINIVDYYHKGEIAFALWDKIEPYLADPETAFLVMRSLRRTSRDWSRGLGTSDISKRVVFSIRNAMYHFEWEECEAIFDDIFSPRFFIPTIIPITAFEYVIQFADKMPRVLESQAFRSLSRTIDPKSIDIDTRRFSRSDAEWQDAISVRNKIAQGNKYSLCLDALKSLHYSYPPLQPLLSVLSCPLQRVLDSFIGGDPSFYEHTPTLAEIAVYNEIARYIDSADLSLRDKAWRYVDRFLALDIYRCDIMLGALSATAFANTVDFTYFKKTKRKQCVPKEWENDSHYPIYRHYGRKDSQIHLNNGLRSCLCNITEGEKMKYSSDWTLRMRVKRGTAFSSIGHHPLVAGYGRDGKCAYVARVFSTVFCCGGCRFLTGEVLCTLTERMKPEDLRIEITCPHQKAPIIPEYLDVIVFRYAPDAYPKTADIDEEGLDATGPFSWRPARGHELGRSPYRVRAITTEEAMASEEMLDEGGHPTKDEGSSGLDLALDEPGDEGSDSESDEVESLSYEVGDDVASDFETRESDSLSCDVICQLEIDTESIDVDQEIQDVGGYPTADEESTESKLMLDEPTVECSEVDPDLDPNEVESLSCEAGDEAASDLKSHELDSLSCDGIGKLETDTDSVNEDLPVCDGDMLVPELDGPVAGEIGGRDVASADRKAEYVSRFITADFHQVIIVVLSVALGFILTRIYDTMHNCRVF